MNLPPSERYPSGQQTLTAPPLNGTVRSGGQHVYLRRFARGTVPDPSPTCAHASPCLQQTGPLPGDSSQARVPFGQHFAVPP
jgi:hypothetical protein